MEKTEDLFSNRQIYRLLWPLLIEQLLNVLVGMVDVVMVASLGEAAVSGVSLVDSINNLVIQFLAAMTAGGTVVCSQFIGMKNDKKANRSAGLVLAHSIAMIIWPVAFLIPHALRAANDAAFTMVIAAFSMWVFRVAFAYLFVKGMHLSIYYVWYAMFIDWMFRTIVFLWRFRGFDGRIRKIVL